MDRVLVTGGAGFIGSHIVDQFVTEGKQVFVIDNLSTGSIENLNKQAKFSKLDIRSLECEKAIVEFKPTVIVHAAAQISVTESMKNPSADVDINVMGLMNILNSTKRLAEKPFVVFISTGGAIYGDDSACPASEDHSTNPSSFYGLSKLVSEMYLNLWQRSFGLTYTVLRLSNVYGPRQNPHGEAGVVAIFCKNLLAGNVPSIFGTGDQTRDYIYVADVVSAVVQAVKRKGNGTYNIGTSIETSVNHLYQSLIRVMSLDVQPNYQPVRPGEQLRSCILASKAKQELDWSAQVKLDQGLSETANWFRSAGK